MDKLIIKNLCIWQISTENIKLIVSKHNISEKKKNKNLQPLYSTLNLDTNSLSLSAKSKGVRLNSISHKTNIGIIKRHRELKLLVDSVLLTEVIQFQDLKDLLKNKINNNNKIS